MGLHQHNIFRVVIPGIVILIETILFIYFFFYEMPSPTEAWSVLAQDFSKSTLLLLLALLLGGLYRFSGITHWIDDRTVGGMKRVNENIRLRLLGQFETDPELKEGFARLPWPAIKRIFFQFVDELPYLKTTNELSLYTGIGFYSFIDVGILSLISLLLGFLTTTLLPYVPIAAWIYLFALSVVICLAWVGAEAVIKKHIGFSNSQLDAILADQPEKLRERFLGALSIKNS